MKNKNNMEIGNGGGAEGVHPEERGAEGEAAGNPKP
jgi:hypothetical protein